MSGSSIAGSGPIRALRREYEESRLFRGLQRVWRGGGRKCRESLLLGAFLRESKLSAAWEASVTCRLLALVLSLPGVLLHRLYLALKEKMDESVLMGLIFEAGDGAALLESWLLLGLWVIPFARWDNGYHLMAFAAVLLLLYLRLMSRGGRLRVDRLGFFLCLFGGAVFLAIPVSYDPALSLRFLRYHLICMACVITTVSAPRDRGDLLRLAGAAAFVVLVSSAWAAYQRIQGVEVVVAYVDASMNEGMPGRVQSYFDNPNTFAQVLVMLLPLTAAAMLGARRWYSRLGALLALVLGGLALGMTYSRASWLGLLAAAGVFLLLWRPRLIPPILLLGILCIPLLPDTILNRFLTIGQAGSDTTFTSRFPLYRAGAELLRRSPLTGAGLGTDAVRMYIFDHGIYDLMIYFGHLHDLYLEVWAEMGLLGLLSFLGAMLWGLKGMARRCRRRGDPAVKTVAAACCAGTVGSLLTGVVDHVWAYPRVMCIFWFVFALGLAAVRLLGEEGPREEKGGLPHV